MSKVLVELVIVIVCIALLGFYHLMLLRKLRTSPATTAMGRHRRARDCWLDLNGDGSRELVVIQALRNLIMSATFLASTSVLLAAGLLGAVLATEDRFVYAHSLNVLGVQSMGLWLFKALLLAATFLGTFFSFSLAIRSFNHLGFMLPCQWKEEIPLEDAAREMDRGALHYSLGMRGFYLAMPLVLWLFGPLWMLAGTVLLILVLHRVD